MAPTALRRVGLATLAATTVALAATTVALDPAPARADAPAWTLVSGVEYGGVAALARWQLVGRDAPFGATAGHGERLALRAGAQLLPWCGADIALGLLPHLSSDSRWNYALDAALDLRFFALPLAMGTGARPWHPYALAGVGLLHNVSGDLDRDTDAQGRFGLGVRGMLSDALALRIEIVDVVTDGPAGTPGNLLVASLGFDVYPARFAAPPPAPAPDPEVRVVTVDVFPDADGDGVHDRLDLCPDAPGRPADDGCPPPPAPTAPPAPVAPPAPPPTPEGVVAKGATPVHIVYAVYFDLGSEALDDDARALLGAFAREAAARPDLDQVLVEGHADDHGTPRFNVTLSTNRADTVRAFLVEAGLPADRVVAKGYGEARPVLVPARGVERASSRRVEIRFVARDE